MLYSELFKDGEIGRNKYFYKNFILAGKIYKKLLDLNCVNDNIKNDKYYREYERVSMNKEILKNGNKIYEFVNYLKVEEKSKATVAKYERDLRKFLRYLEKVYKATEQISKEVILDYKEMLMSEYESSSVNSMLAALNQYLVFIGKEKCRVKQVKIQRKAFLEEEKCLTIDEARKLMVVAGQEERFRLKMIIETLCDTGVRVSELAFFTVKRIKSGIIKIHNKGKTRVIALTNSLRIKLLRYAKDSNIKNGLIFITKAGNVMDRSNLWREIKELCGKAGVVLKKGFPHNFRRLFARNYYKVEKDIVSLADIMGHSQIETTRLYTIMTYREFVEKLKNMKSISKK